MLDTLLSLQSTYTAESEFAEELKELERESFEMDARIASLKEEKADLLKDMEELENQVVMWEKKIKLEKEMQETLDPTGTYRGKTLEFSLK